MSTEPRNGNKSVNPKTNERVQLLTFKLDDQEYALNIANVVQVVRMVALTRPPQAPDYIDGIFNLRGKVIPVINIRKRCGLPSKSQDLDTQLLIAKADGRTMAIAVDAVSEVLALSTDSVEPPEQIGPEMKFLSAVGKVDDRLILILDPNTLLTHGNGPLQLEHAEKVGLAV
jgi:purine-binding chemotaxis protein CheW